jgi:hypothetical protein
LDPVLYSETHILATQVLLELSVEMLEDFAYSGAFNDFLEVGEGYYRTADQQQHNNFYYIFEKPLRLPEDGSLSIFSDYTL